MCGITGILHLDGKPIEPSILKAMADTLTHRGPDDEGFYLNYNYGSNGISHNPPSSMSHDPRATGYTVGLAHRRLSIIDLEGGKQPLSNEDSTVWITYNGEIYNFRTLSEELVARGHRFRTKCDTEVIVHAYEEWGENCVDRLRGMFAFAIWDQRNQHLVLARDRLGIKPLYYLWDGKRLLFGSEIKAILAYPGVLRDINIQALYDYFCLLYIPAPKSIFKDIFKLSPGHVLTLGPNANLTIRQYWDLCFEPDERISEQQWCDRILEKLQEAVKIRLMSDVPLGAFLSGGIDSSAVVGLMTSLMNEPVRTASIGFEEQKFNELPYARQVASHFGTNHHEEIVRPDAVAILEKLAWYFDEPFADSSAVPTYYVSQAARGKVTVALSGDGGDENFAGYRRYYFDLLENQLRGILPTFFRKYAVGGLARVYPKADWAPQVFRAKTLLTNLSLDPVDGYFNSMSWFGGLRSRLFVGDFYKELSGYSPLEVFKSHFAKAPADDPLSAVQYLDIKTYLVDDILTKVDRTSMAHALEVRVPILDHEFMEMVATIPPNLKLKGREGKYILKKALKSILPHDILYRRKMGFSIPLSCWLREELKGTFSESVFSQSAISTSFLDMKTVHQMWREHQSGSRDWSPELWAILFWEKWGRKWLLS